MTTWQSPRNSAVAGAWFLTAATVGHFLMEFVCVGGLFARGGAGPATILLYNACAFLVPVAIGAISDGRIGPVPLAVTGCGVASIGAVVGGWSPAGAALLGLGNAAFHIAGGSAALRMRRPATAVGIFVGSGAVGLTLGVRFAAVTSVPWEWVALVGCMTTALIVAAARRTDAVVGRTRRGEAAPPTGPGAAPSAATMTWVAGGVAAAVALGLVRTGLIVATPTTWKHGAGLVLAAACAAALGKSSGGLIADRWGWMPTASVAIAGAGIAAVVAPTSAIAGLIGIALINMTVPLVLAALAIRVPGREGLVFGSGQAIQFTTVFLVGVSWSSVSVMIATVCCLALAAIAFARPRPGADPRPAGA